MGRSVPICAVALMVAVAAAGCTSRDNTRAVDAPIEGGSVPQDGATHHDPEASTSDALSGDTSDSSHVDVDADLDAHVDASIGNLSCEQLQGAWHDFVELASTCNSDADCITFERFDSSLHSACDCPDGLQATLNKTEVTQAEVYAARYDEVCSGLAIWTSHILATMV